MVVEQTNRGERAYDRQGHLLHARSGGHRVPLTTSRATDLIEEESSVQVLLAAPSTQCCLAMASITLNDAPRFSLAARIKYRTQRFQELIMRDEPNKRLSDSDCLSEYAYLFSSHRRRASQLLARELFFGALLAEGGGNFFLLYAHSRIAALGKILRFGAITHHAKMNNLILLFGVLGGRGSIGHGKCAVCGALLSNRRVAVGFRCSGNYVLEKLDPSAR